MTIEKMPKLCYSLNLLKNNQMSYDNEISKDWICIKLQEKINLGKRKQHTIIFLCLLFSYIYVFHV